MPGTEGGDRDLLVRIAAGEPAAFEKLYEGHSAAAYGLAVRLLRDPGTAEDVVHETFLSVWRQTAVYRQDRGTVRSWLLTCVHYRAIAHIRRRHDDRYQAINAADVLLDEGDTGVQARHHIKGEAVRAALRQLPVARKRQDSERKRAVARTSLRWPLPDGPYAACSTAHTSPHRSWNRRR